MLFDEAKFKAPPTFDAIDEMLLEAADIIEKHGWIQRSFGDAEVGFCLWGALREASHRGLEVFITGDFITSDLAALLKLKEYLVQKNGSCGSTVMWNDSSGRTKEEVMAALRGAAGVR